MTIPVPLGSSEASQHHFPVRNRYRVVPASETAAENCPGSTIGTPPGRVGPEICQRHGRMIRPADTRDVSTTGWGVGWVPSGPAELNGAPDETPKGGCVKLRRAWRPPQRRKTTQCTVQRRRPGVAASGAVPVLLQRPVGQRGIADPLPSRELGRRHRSNYRLRLPRLGTFQAQRTAATMNPC